MHAASDRMRHTPNLQFQNGPVGQDTFLVMQQFGFHIGEDASWNFIVKSVKYCQRNVSLLKAATGIKRILG